MNKQLIIIGGGTSINEGIKQELWPKLVDRWTVGINSSYKFFKPTVLSFMDSEFYKNNINELKDLDLIIGRYDADNYKLQLPNTILIEGSHKVEVRNNEKKIFYKHITGQFTLSLFINILDVGEIFLLGFDCGNIKIPKNNEIDRIPKMKRIKAISELPLEEIDINKIDTSKDDIIEYNNKYYRAITHFYQRKVEHSGVGKINCYYDTTTPYELFKPYMNEKIKIYNVSSISRIPTTIFQKISYQEMFDKLEYKDNQDKIREEIKKYISKCTIFYVK